MNPSDADNIPAPLKRLRDALWGEPEDDISHAKCRALLPAFVQAEADGEPVAKLYARVKHHLDHCDECGEEYALLLDLELAEMRGEIEFASAISPTRRVRSNKRFKSSRVGLSNRSRPHRCPSLA